MHEVDQIVLNFNKTGILIINISLAFIMFGVALDLRINRFRTVIRMPKSLVLGVVSQIILLPFFTFLLILIFKPIPSIALGMILVASCPGGNISNFISAMAKANVELSIALTIFSSLLAILITPFNFATYGNLYAPTQEILKDINLDWVDMVMTIGLIIVLPLIVGFIFKRRWPALVLKIKGPLKNISMLLFLVIVVAALSANWNFFIQWIGYIFFIVLLHNAMAIILGYSLGALFTQSDADKKSLAIETGIQNSGVGLLLIFTFFDGLGGMAIVTAWWGIWHIISGFAVAYFWNRKRV